MIKNIIFDIGDVLVKTRQLDFFVDKGFDAKTAASLAEATYLTPVWKELDRGIWSLDEIVDSFVKRAPDLESNIRSSMADLGGFIMQYPYAKEWINDLKAQGYKVYCLSNISDKICTDCAPELDFLPLTDGNILSYKERLIKPDPAIFTLTLERFGIAAEETIFTDDNTENIASANALGIHGIVFTDKPAVDKEIWRLSQ